ALCGTVCMAAPALSQSGAPAPTPAPSQTEGPPPPPGPGYGGPHRDGPEHRLERLQRALNLTPDQTTQVKALFEAERGKMEALRANTALQPEDRRTQMRAIHEDTQTKMHALLTPDQATKYDALEARMRERGGGPPPPPPGPGLQ
ncbi:MAG TPA: hypothetical protein VKV02_08800, partial [Acidobacteriaceae bacterium]|nr:hypothetical protein [Acidobacteriaceae bacterium]